VIDSGKHTSLLRQGINHDQKRFIVQALGVNAMKRISLLLMFNTKFARVLVLGKFLRLAWQGLGGHPLSGAGSSTAHKN